MEERLSRLERAYEHLATKADLADLRTELLVEVAKMEARLTRWTVGTIIVGLGVAVAVLKLLE